MEGSHGQPEPQQLEGQPNAPPALRLDLLDDTTSLDYDSVDTPREPALGNPLISMAEGLPTSPSRKNKSKSRAAHSLSLSRNASFASRNSLRDSKVLMVTGMKRSESLLQPDLFRYHNHFEFLGVVGRTHLSEVFRVRHRVTGELYAVKRSRRRFKSKLHRERCLREISAVAALPAHQNIVGQYRAWQEGGHFYIQMDLCEGGNLQQLISAVTSAGSLLSNEELWTVLWEVASGLQFLHGNGVLHLDIKPENIYRDASGVCQIGDFGLAVGVGTKEWWEEGDGNYVAPELLKSNGSPSPAADIYSLGVTMYECATGVKLMQQLHSGASPADVSLPGRPPALEALLRWMLQPEPEQRPSAAQILQYISSQGGVLLAEASAAMNTGMVAGMDAGMQPTTAQDGAAAGWSQEDGQGCVAREAASPANKTTPTPAASPSVATLFGIASLAASPFASVGCAYGQEQGDESAGCGVPPCPFGELSQESSGEEVVGGSAAPMPQHAQQAQQAQQHQPFSFAPLPLQPAASASPGRLPAPGSFAEEDGGSAAATPVAPRPLGRFGGRGGLSAAARRAAAAAGGLQRWVPSLSPLVSEGALTPGALEGLSQPSAVKPGLFRSMGRDLSVVIPSSAAHAMPSSSDTPDEASPMLSPGAGGLGSGGGGGSGSQPRHIRLQHRNSTDSKDGWRLSRRDMISPDSDALARSVTESELYSFSCGTGGSVSSLDFMDTGISQPMSPEFQSAAAAADQTATPELFQRVLPPSDAAAAAAAAAPAEDAGGAAKAAPAFPPKSSLAWDLHTSPEFLMQLPPGSPCSPSCSSSMEDSLPSRSFSSIRRFPTLDSMGSMQQLDPAGMEGGKPGSFSSLPPVRLTSCFELAPLAGAKEPGRAAARAGVPADPSLQPRKRPLSRHNSRRGLLAVLSREGSLASCGSLDQVQLVQKARMMEDVGTEGGFSQLQEQGMCDGSGGNAQAAVAVWALGGGAGAATGLKASGSSSCLKKPSLLEAATAPAGLVPFSQQPSPLRERIVGMTLSDGSAAK